MNVVEMGIQNKMNGYKDDQPQRDKNTFSTAFQKDINGSYVESQNRSPPGTSTNINANKYDLDFQDQKIVKNLVYPSIQ